MQNSFTTKFRCISTLIPQFNCSLNWFEANASNASGVKCKVSKYIKLRTKLPQYKEIFVFLKDAKAYQKKFDNTLSCYSSPKHCNVSKLIYTWAERFKYSFILCTSTKMEYIYSFECQTPNFDIFLHPVATT